MLGRCLSSVVMSASVESWPKVILFGDSITQFSFSNDGCWGALVADSVQRKCDVINRGFSGYNVRWCRHILPQLVTKEVAKDTAAITVFLGANDSNDIANLRQHVPLQEYRDGLTAMVEHLMSVDVSGSKIILISPPAFDADEWEKECIKKGRSLTKNNKTTGEYAKTCVAVARECGTHIVDLYSIMMESANWESFLNDGLHLSASGSRLLFSFLEPLVKQLTTDLPDRYPLWDEVDAEALKTSLVSFKE